MLQFGLGAVFLTVGLRVAAFDLRKQHADSEGVQPFHKLSDFLEDGRSSDMLLDEHRNQISYHRVVMRDGESLDTVIINPYPYNATKGAMLVRSPYGPITVALTAPLFTASNGFVAVLQDDRGTFLSGGQYDIWRGERMDVQDAMEWIVSQPWSNGEVFTAGASADGINEAVAVFSAPPMLKGQWWMWTTGNGHHFAYDGGAYRKDIVEGYMKFMNPEIHGSGPRVIQEVREHEAYGPWWRNITICPGQMLPSDPGCKWSNVKWPVLVTSGWWDIFMHTSVEAWSALISASDSSVRDRHAHIVGPLGHCSLAVTDVHPILLAAELASLRVSQELAAEMFGGVAGPVRSRLGRLNLFVMGGFAGPLFGQRWNYWTSLGDWPAAELRPLYLGDEHRLTDQAPELDGAETYEYDPNDPAPMLGGNNLPLPGGSHVPHCGHADQWSREIREDVLVFDSEPLPSDLPVVGNIRARLFVSSTANDTDFVVTVSDLSSKKSSLVRYGVQRMRWRDSESIRSPPMRLDRVYEVDIDLYHTAYVFPRGHRIRVAVSSAAAPYYNANSNTGRNELTEVVTPVIAHNTIYFATDKASSIVLPVVQFEDIPRNPNFSGDVATIV